LRLHTKGDEDDDSTWFPFVLSTADVLFHLALALYNTGDAALNLEAILHLERILRLDPAFYELGLEANSLLARHYHSTAKSQLPEACQAVCALLEDIHSEHVLVEGAGIKTEPEYWYNISYVSSRSVTFGYQLPAYRGMEILGVKTARHAVKLQRELVNRLEVSAPEYAVAMETLANMENHCDYQEESVGEDGHTFHEFSTMG
jgi:hypothetical protein